MNESMLLVRPSYVCTCMVVEGRLHGWTGFGGITAWMSARSCASDGGNGLGTSHTTMSCPFFKEGTGPFASCRDSRGAFGVESGKTTNYEER
jgi:hypothetical protein